MIQKDRRAPEPIGQYEGFVPAEITVAPVDEYRGNGDIVGSADVERIIVPGGPVSRTVVPFEDRFIVVPYRCGVCTGNIIVFGCIVDKYVIG